MEIGQCNSEAEPGGGERRRAGMALDADFQSVEFAWEKIIEPKGFSLNKVGATRHR